MQKKFYITTSIPYVNAAPHIGHAMEFVQADAIARYHRMMKDDVYFLSGSDDNSLTNVLAAEKAGKPIKEFVDANSQRFAELKDILNISYDQFFQTSQAKHFKGAQQLWSSCNKDDIYKKIYKGLYCNRCEQYYNQEDLIDNRLCPDHKIEVEVVEEENYFFKLTNYQNKLHDLISTDQLKILPEFRKNEMLSFIEQGLEDFSISRSQNRARDWGVPVPDDSTQIMYVWFDALSNYITALGYGNKDDELFNKYWPADLHCIGKGINRFHTIYWPAILLSAGILLPKSVMVHGYITVNGEKMSKTLGNVFSPRDIVDKYGIDATRYYMLREIPTYNDGDYSDHRMQEIYNSNLANELGNLISRTTTMLHKYSDSRVPAQPKTNISAISDDPTDSAIRALALQTIQNDPTTSSYAQFMGQYELNKAIEHIFNKISECNKVISSTEPWKLAKNGNQEKVQEILYWLSHAIHNIAWELYPFLPQTSKKIAAAFNISGLLENNPNMYDGMHEWTENAEIQSNIPILFSKLTQLTIKNN